MFDNKIKRAARVFIISIFAIIISILTLLSMFNSNYIDIKVC